MDINARLMACRGSKTIEVVCKAGEKYDGGANNY